MSTVGAYEAKTHLPRLLERVSRGERITITKHGIPVAELVPVPASKKADINAVISELRSLRQNLTLKGLSIKEMIEEGRRY
ncbi:MAG: type II toxin-antitoxin system Phd/YefM family antitoxin [Deltaproteobacteria bacterium]|nr:type II toxin-antitoxin system Phd/YefM family antitoxin [Deltaproteobacteria bacterium]MBW2072399.1 type II toxin-antitoxin system Phd/YefM family antitoxin [Deltaproteobacteria bacterium]